MSCGIYKIENLINGKVYIGQSRNIEKRWSQHRNYRESENHYPLYRAFSKYGIENFSFEILEECSLEELNNKELNWGIKLNSLVPNGYNQTPFIKKDFHERRKISNVEQIKNRLLSKEKITHKQLAEEFEVSIDTIRDINVGRSWFDPNLTYPLRPSKYSIIYNFLNEDEDYKKQRFCSVCGVEINRKTITEKCLKCANEKKRIVERPSPEQLEKELRESNFTQVGKKYGVSDNAVRKWCKSYGMSTSSKDYK